MLSLVAVGRRTGNALQPSLLLLVIGLLVVMSHAGMAQEVVECNPGMSFSTVFNQCLRCRQGKYKSTRSTANCTDCPRDADGRQGSTRGDGAINRSDCYFRPYVKGFTPRYGPLAGGTRLTITMGYLTDEQNLTSAFVANIPANCSRVLGQPLFVCITPPNYTSVTTGNIRIELMDTRSEYRSTSPYDFNYLPNPVIASIANPTTFLSGGKVLTVLGRHLLSVAHPEMVVTRIYMKNSTRNFYSNCTHVNSELMTCPTPNITEPEIFQDGGSQEALQIDDFRSGRRRRRQTSEEEPRPINGPDLEYYVRFHLDGAGDGGRGRNISVFMDPEFNEFRDDLTIKYYLPSRHEHLFIRGRYLKHSIDVTDVDVTVGEATCVVTSLDSNLLVCHPPAKRPLYGPWGRGPRDSHYVQVVVGNLVFRVGYLLYVNEQLAHQHAVLVTSLLVAGLAALLALWAAVVWWQRRRLARRQAYCKAQPDAKLSISVESGDSEETEGSGQSEGSRGSSGADDSFYTGRGSSGTSEGTATTGVSSLEVEVETSQMMHIDVWSALEEPLKSRVKECQIDSHRLTLGECVGVGTFGRVFRGEMDAEDGSKVPVAVKTLRDGFSSAAELPQFLEEALIMEGFDHPHILPLYGVAISDSLPFVVSEYMDCGDLRSYIKGLPGHTVSPVLALGLARQVAEGMTYLSEKGFVHRDLAARNCLINSGQVVKIGDFGLSRDLHGQDYYRVEDKHRPLPVKWMAIESLNLGKFSTKSDVWSFGVVMWELLTRGRTPYVMVQSVDLKDYINADNRLPHPETASQTVYELMLSCWRVDPANRPTFSELVTCLNDVIKALRVPDGGESANQISEDNAGAALL